MLLSFKVFVISNTELQMWQMSKHFNGTPYVILKVASENLKSNLINPRHEKVKDV